MLIKDYKTAVALEDFRRRREREEERAERERAAAAENAPTERRDIVVAIPGRDAMTLDMLPDRDLERAEIDETDPAIRVTSPPAFDFLFTPEIGGARYRCAYGGRGSAKSWQFARALLVHGMRRKLRVLCAREYQSSIKDSVHRLLSNQIRVLTLGGFYTVRESTIFGANGTEFIFKGLRKDIDQVKSTEDVDICWVEEAQSVSDPSWETLIPTIRANGSEIWVTFNPDQPNDATYRRFVEKPPPKAIVRKVTYLDNPWLPDVLHEEERHMLETDPEAHAHVWGGEPWSRSDAQVLAGKWRVMDFTPDPATWYGPYYGVDWGFATDPTVWVRLWLYDKRLYLEYESSGVQLDNDQTAAAGREIPDLERHEVRGDSSRPETINEMKKRQLRVVGAVKWTGSVEDGITHLRTYTEIIIHPRCKRAIQEARLWRYKVDPRTQEVLPVLRDGNDHVWDAVRYALAPMIRQRERVKETHGSISQAIG